MKYRVDFIGYGYETVKMVIVKAGTYEEAFDQAKKLYSETNQTFEYMALEAEEIR